MTESTRNGESSLLVSTIEPTDVYPSPASVGLNARTAIGWVPRPSASSNAPITWPKSSSAVNASAASAGSRRAYMRANVETTAARSGASRSTTRSSSS